MINDVAGQGPASVDPSSSKAPSLTRTISRLRWILYKRSFRKNWGQIIGTVIGVLYGAGGLVFLASLLFGGIFAPEEMAALPVIIRALGIMLLLAWTIAPIISFGLDDTLSPKRFAAFGRSTRELLRPVFIASFISLPVVLTLIAMLMAVVAQALWLVLAMSGTGVTLIGGIAAFIALIPASIATIVVCLLIPRAFLAWRSTWRMSRRRRELLSGIVLVCGLSAAYGFSLVSSGGASLFESIGNIVAKAYGTVLWTPFGAPMSIPMDLAEGHWIAALARIAVTGITIVLVWKWWAHAFNEGMLDALREAAGDSDLKVTALVPKALPSNALGAVAGKSLRYWRRDTRYSMALLVMPIMTLFFVAMSVLSEDQRFMGWVAVALTAWMGGITISNEIGFDGPSSWVNITAGINNRANLLGRYAALALFIVPWLLFLCILVPFLQGKPAMIALAIPASFGFLLSSWGISMLVTAYFPYPAPAPGSMKSSSSGGAWVSMLSAFLGTWLPMVPSIILIALGLTIVPGLEYVGSILALVIGVVTCWLGLRFAAARLDTRYAEAFQATKAFAG